MRFRIVVALIPASILLAFGSPAGASSYQQIGGAIIDPIQSTTGGVHPYAGPNLAPTAQLPSAALSAAELGLADLVGANLNDADLMAANLADSNLSGGTQAAADLSNATMQNVVMSFSIANGADLSSADLSAADLSFTNLAGANLTGADLSGAVLLSADLDLADVSSANMSGTNFSLSFNLSSTSWTGTAPTYDGVTDFAGTGFDPVAAGWTFVPEPSMALLINAGILGLATASRRRIRRHPSATP